MTPTLETVLQEAQALPLSDRRALVTLLEPPKPLEEIAAEQGLKPYDVDAARRQAAGIWPDDESADDFTAWLRAERAASKKGSLQISHDAMVTECPANRY
jgi:hypothetical protein